VFGVTLCLLAVLNLVRGTAWYVALGLLVIGALIILGRRRIFRPGVERTKDLVVCRYVPWYEGNAYFLNLGLPLLAVCMIAAGFTPGNPVWLRFGGVILLLVVPLFVESAVRMWRKSAVRIMPSALTVPSAAPKFEPTDLSREYVISITPTTVNSVSGAKSLQVEIAYRLDSTDETATVLLGPQLSVEPENLLDALVVWKDASVDDPLQLMYRIERILRGRSPASV
jgi:hypothetical protein